MACTPLVGSPPVSYTNEAASQGRRVRFSRTEAGTTAYRGERTCRRAALVFTNGGAPPVGYTNEAAL